MAAAGGRAGRARRGEAPIDIVATIRDRTRSILAGLAAAGVLPADIDLARFTVVPDPRADRADLVVNAPLVYGGVRPDEVRRLAATLARDLAAGSADVAAAVVAGRGFVNVTLSPAALASALAAALVRGPDYGRGHAGQPLTVRLASAEDAGPVSLDQARARIVADALARILAFAGHPDRRGAGRAESIGPSPGDRPAGLREILVQAAGRRVPPLPNPDLERLAVAPCRLLRHRLRVPTSNGAAIHAMVLQNTGRDKEARVEVEVLGRAASASPRDPACPACRETPACVGQPTTAPLASPRIDPSVRVTLREALALGDATALRFAMLCRRTGQALDLDPAAAADASHAGPLFDVRYAHARARRMIRQAADAMPGLDLTTRSLAGADFAGLTRPVERALLRLVVLFPDRIAVAAADRDPQRLGAYLLDLARAVHGQWKSSKDQPQLRFVNEEQRDLAKARLGLVTAAALVLQSGLGVLGVSAPDEIR